MFRIECKNLIQFDVVNNNMRIWSKECVEKAMGPFPIQNVRIGYYVDEARLNFRPGEYMTDPMFNESDYVEVGFGDLVYNEERNAVDLVNGIVECVPGIDPIARNTLNHCAVRCTGSASTIEHDVEIVKDIDKDTMEVYLCMKSGFSNEKTTIEKIDDKGNDALEIVKQYCMEHFHEVNTKRSNVEYKFDNRITETGERADDADCERMWGEKRMFDGELFVYQNIISYINSLQCNGIDSSEAKCTEVKFTDEIDGRYEKAARDAEWYKNRMENYRQSLFDIVDLIRKFEDKIPRLLSYAIEAEMKRY